MATSSNEIGVLFRIRADAAQVKTATAEAKAAVAQLRQSFGPELASTVSLTNKTFADLGNNLSQFVGQRIPLVGGAFVRLTDGIKGLDKVSAGSEKALAAVGQSIESIAKSSGKTVPQIAAFLSGFVKLETQAAKNDAAFKFFGGSVDLIGNKTAKFLPELEKAEAGLSAVSASSAVAASRIAALGGPIAIAVAAIVALHVAGAIAAKEIFELTKRTADFQGRMFDLAQQTGLAVETLSALEVMARTTGGSLDTIAQATVLFQRKLDEAQDPLSKTAELFRKLNVDTADTETSLRSAFTALAKMPEGFAQTNAAAELFGARGGKQVLAILKESQGDIDATTNRLRELGILISDDVARSADQFNDELVILELQLRALTAAAVEDLIPAITELIRTFGDLVTAVRPVASIFSTIASTALRPVVDALKGVSLAVQALTGDYKGLAKAIVEAEKAQTIPPLNVSAPAPVPLPGDTSPRQAATEAANQAEAVVAAVKRKVSAQNEALDELFQRGRRTRQKQAKETIAGNKSVLLAEQQRIDRRLELKEQEIKALDEAQRNRGQIVRRDTDDYRAITKDIEKLQQERLDKENQFEVSSRAIRAKAAKERADSIRNQTRNEGDLLIAEFDRTIKDIEAQIARKSTTEEAGLTIIEQLEQAKIEARRKSLEDQRDIGFLTITEQQDLNNQIKALNQEADQLLDDQRNRRLQKDREAAERTREIKLAEIDTTLELQRIAGERTIATIESLAALRIKTEEEAAREVLQIRLDLIDQEIEVTKTKLSAASSIVDVGERTKAEAELNNQLKVLNAQRVTIQTEGNRAIGDAQQEDISNQRRYADDLKDIKERIRDIELESAREVIRLMQIHFASRRDIVRTRLKLDLDEEAQRHRQAEETLDNLEQENRESKKTQQEKLEFEAEINRLREAEAERHRLAMQGIKDQGKKDEKEADPLGRFDLDIESLKQFASVIEDSVVPLGEILRNTFLQVADAIGQTVASWVLLGETGPAVMRKILAQALASVAAEAAVNAIKELALGFATLFFNPAESAAHFTAAGLWGSIAGVAAVAGRGVAGDLFKSKGAGGGSGSGDSSSGQLNPLTLARNAGPGSQQQLGDQIQPQRMIVEIRVNDSKFGRAITGHIVDDVNNAGPIREILSGDGNLNRG